MALKPMGDFVCDVKRCEDILADLYARREEAKSGGLDLPQLYYMNQQIVAHETLLRLVEERAEVRKEKGDTTALDAQIKFWMQMADMDAQVSPQLAPAEVAPVAVEPVAVASRRKSKQAE